MTVLLDKNKPFFKANLHAHSTQSDGTQSVETLKEAYKKHGYFIVAFTDHEHLIDNSHLDDREFLTITSCEVAIKEFANLSTLKKLDMRVCHLNFYALDQHNVVTPCYSSTYDHFLNDSIRSLVRYEKDYERTYSKDGINEMIKIANEQGFLVAYNHPTWSLENATDYIHYENLFAVEIYNHSCVLGGRIDDEHAFDDFLRAGKRIFCSAADDNHNLRGLDSPGDDSFGGWVQINAEKLEYGAVMNALQSGNFYASTGPSILALEKDGEQVRIETSPCQKICLTTKGRRTQTVTAENGANLTHATFSLREDDGFFRIRVIDEKGKKAWTQAYSPLD